MSGLSIEYFSFDKKRIIDSRHYRYIIPFLSVFTPGFIMAQLKFCFYVPQSHLEQVKEAVFAAGCGNIGAYSKCCWQIKGQGQFIAAESTNPFVGRVSELTQIEEFKVETVCDEKNIINVLAEFHQSHPYEEPAYEIFPMLTAKDFNNEL